MTPASDHSVWVEFAEQQIASPRKARTRAAEKRDAALAERSNLHRGWRIWRRQRVEELTAGPHGAAVRALREFLAAMKLGDASALVAAVENGPWRDADADTRHEVLCLVDHAIIALRERSGLPPFDDRLPGQPPTAFEIIKGILR